MEIYTVETGDNIDEIAARFQVNVSDLIYDNQLVYPYRLAVGQALVIRLNRNRERKEIISSGYAYPFISPWVLRETLPYLSEISVFSYGFTQQGELVPPFADDEWMIEEARAHQALPILTLTSLGEDGHFNNMLISSLVNNEKLQEQLIWHLGSVMVKKGYAGINVDFEYILAEEKDKFTGFVRKLTEVMNVFGYKVSVALPPKTSRDQQGLLYQGVDYKALGGAANEVFIMAYEWGYTYGAPMAVAPAYMVRRVLEYALTEIPPEKIILGMPNYGYDWPLPYERGTTKARTMGNIEAVQLAIQYGVPIQFDSQALSPYFQYWQYGILHEVWFEDARSVQAKMDLVQEYGLKGAGYWQLMQLFRASWLIMEDEFIVKKPLFS